MFINGLLKKIMFLGFSVTMLFTTAFCGTVGDDDIGILAGYVLPSDATNYGAEVIYDIDDVTLEFYFGVTQKFIKSALSNKIYTCESVDVFFSNGNVNLSNISFIRNIPIEEFFTDAYLQDNIDGIIIFYNHSEMLTIPKRMFIGESGIVGFSLRVNATKIKTNDYFVLSNLSCSIYYKVEGETVIISRKNII